MPNEAASKATDWVMLIVTIMLGIYLMPVIVSAVADIDFSAAAGWNFTGSAGAKTIVLLLPFIFVIGLVVYFIARILGKV